MAYRRASFGRLPQVQPNIESTLAALSRQWQAQEDQNIMSAWKAGGEWHGKKVTDADVLAYWNGRMKGLDPKDPTYEDMKQQVFQLTYSVEQSKADLAHLQGKLSDSGYAQFFLGWAKKVPKDSEWWRALQKDAAQFMEQARAKGAATAAKAKQDSFNAYVAVRQGSIDLGNALTDAIQQISKETGLNITDHGDVLLQMLSDEFSSNPEKFRVLGDVLPRNFDGQFTHAFVATNLSQAQAAYGQVATRSKKDGYASQYANAAQGQSAMASWGTNLNVWGPAQSYDMAYQAFSDVWNDPTSSLDG